MELEADDMFFLACAEACRDGRLDPEEEGMLMRLRVGFGIRPIEASKIMKKARDTRRDTDTYPSPFDRTELFSQACRLAWIDSELTDDERDILLHLARVLGVEHGKAVTLLSAARRTLGLDPPQP